MIPFVFNQVSDALLKELGLKDVKWNRCRMLVVVGDNGAGKSLLRRVFQCFLRKENDKNTEVIHISQQGRSTNSAGHLAIIRNFIYGSEDDEATSVISAHTLVTGMRTSRGRENGHFIIYDEPEIGMSEESALGAAIWFTEQLRDWPAKLRGMVVCTHDRHFASRLMTLPYSKFLWMHHPEATLDDWLNRKIEPINPEQLQDIGIGRWRRVQKIFDENKKKKS